MENKRIVSKTRTYSFKKILIDDPRVATMRIILKVNKTVFNTPLNILFQKLYFEISVDIIWFKFHQALF